MDKKSSLWIGKVVRHKTFGTGTVVRFEPPTPTAEATITIAFSGAERRFLYPSAFDAFLSTFDAEAATMLDHDRKEYASAKKVAAPTYIERRAPSAKEESVMMKKPGQKKQQRLDNVAIKCNFSDGGKNESRIGYCGVCSDAVIENNICVEKRNWCRQPTCVCMQYYHGAITRSQLDEVFSKNGIVCYESTMLRDWIAKAGFYTSGEKRGDPMKMRRVEKNSLAVLTTRKPNSREEARYIFALFLVDDCDEGDARDEGYIHAHPTYRLSFSEKECEALSFWKYHANRKNPKTPVWSSKLFRYLSSDEAIQILRDAVAVKRGTGEEELAARFFSYYCTVNKLDPDCVGTAQGALT